MGEINIAISHFTLLRGLGASCDAPMHEHSEDILRSWASHSSSQGKGPLHFIPRLLYTTNVLLLFFCYKKLEILFLNKIQTFFIGED